MIRYFTQDTSLQEFEKQMMTPPNFAPRGSGLYCPGYRQQSRPMDCPCCANYDPKHPCSLIRCIWLEDRIETGCLVLAHFVEERFGTIFIPDVWKRLDAYLGQQNARFFLHGIHRKRWEHWRDRNCQMSAENKAALFLLTAYEDIWRRVVWNYDIGGLHFRSVRLSGIQMELYAVYQTAKSLVTDTISITYADLANPELVTDEAFHLIISALLLAKYGEIILKFEGRQVIPTNARSSIK